jgi:hypothetical protein
MNLTFIDQLDDEQITAANKIITQANRMGIPPALALSIAFKESSLRPNVKPGQAGEIGIMQIRPETAKMLGVSVEDLKNPNTNIITGLRYLKEALDKAQGDQSLAAVGYNAGIGAITGTNPIPETTVNYVRDLTSYGAFGAPKQQEPPPSQAQPPAQQSSIADQIIATIRQGQAGDGASQQVPPAITPEQARALGMVAGAVPAAVDVPRQVFGKPRTFFAEPTPAPQGGLSSGEKWLKNWADIQKEGARGVPEAAQVYERQKPHGKVTEQIYKMFGNRPLNIAGYLESLPKPPTTLESVTAKLGQMAESGLKVLQPVAKYVGAPFALGEAGFEGVKAYQEATKPEPQYGEAALSGLSAAGALTSLANPPVGLTMMAVPPLVRGYQEHQRMMETDPEYAQRYQQAFSGMGGIRRFPKPQDIGLQ